MDYFVKTEYNNVNNNLLHILRQREIHESARKTFSHKLHVTENFISRLGLETELAGHKGCVNCLEWNQSGTTLASASDDMHLILWDPFRYKKKLVFHTGHSGNIFSVKFMPKSNDTILVTGAGDSDVRVHDITLSDTLIVCNCHTNRVKRIGTAESVPFLFWSSGEDGLILEHDMRMRHDCKSTNPTKNVLINLVNHMGKTAEAKCLAINPMRPEMIAIGANDPYVRIYDRRMIKLSQLPVRLAAPNNFSNAGKGDPDNNIPQSASQYFIAGHLKTTKFRDIRNFTTTYLTFSNNGSELLINMGGEQVYIFDLYGNNNNDNNSYYLKHQDISQLTETENKKIKKSAYGTKCRDDLRTINIQELPSKIEEIKQEANLKFQQECYTNAISLYNKAISLCPYSATLHANRAAAFMKRKWDGDIYSALRDCQITLQLEPQHVKAHFRLARCLNDLKRPIEAHQVIEDFQDNFPHCTLNSSFKALKKDIKETLDSGKKERTTANVIGISNYEKEWRLNTKDFKLRFCGHCNTTTDIKESNFFGNNGQYIVAGSDDGSFFIWDRYTTNIMKVLRGDSRIVNCLQSHPSTCLLATSGIDSVIRLWSPRPEDGSRNEREIENPLEAASANQIRMNTDPFELMIMSMGYRIPISNDDDDTDSNDLVQPATCRTS